MQPAPPSDSQHRGVVYIATGERHIKRACISARSLKRHSPGLPVTLFTDGVLTEPSFDQVVKIKNTGRGFADKVEHLQNSPYDHTLFLDADTYVCNDLRSLYQVLNHFDVAVAHDTFRLHTLDHEAVKDRVASIPEAFPMFNTGVILYKKSEPVWQFLREWLQVHLDIRELNLRKGESYCNDQTAFREALYSNSLRIATLPTEYNCRFVHSFFVNAKVRILHGPPTKLEALEKEVNLVEGNRVFTPSLGVIPESHGLVLITPAAIRRSLARLFHW